MSGVKHFKSALNCRSGWVKSKDTLTIEDVNMPEEILSPLAPLVSEIFADNLKAYMGQNEISTNGVALRSGISQKTLWVTINKKNVPTLDTANRVCDALNVDMRVMMSRLLQPAELNRTKIIGRSIDSLISLPTEKVAAVREVMDAFSK
jgi:DNA-binding phage protein